MPPHSPLNIPSAVKILLKTTYSRLESKSLRMRKHWSVGENDPVSPCLEFSSLFVFFPSEKNEHDVYENAWAGCLSYRERSCVDQRGLGSYLAWQQFLRSMADHYLYICFAWMTRSLIKENHVFFFFLTLGSYRWLPILSTPSADPRNPRLSGFPLQCCLLRSAKKEFLLSALRGRHPCFCYQGNQFQMGAKKAKGSNILFEIMK